MWGGENFLQGGGHMGSKSAPCSPVKPFQKRAPAQPDSFHVIHKVPLGDSPYVKAKHVQLVDKDPDAAIALFWAAINAGDRVDSALKDMAIVMKQQNRPEEAIEAIKSLRNRCSEAAQESLDNVLLDLYKRCERLDDQIALLQHKLDLIHHGMAFNGKRTKTARSQGKKFQVSVQQEATRLLGNLGWAYMQQSNFLAAEAVYMRALSVGPDSNKVCNLGICLMKQGRMEEAREILQSVMPACPDTRWGTDSHLKSYERAQEMLAELEASMGRSSAMPTSSLAPNTLLQSALWQPQQSSAAVGHLRQRSADINKAADHLTDLALPLSRALSATTGFGPPVPSRPVPKKMAAVLGQQQQQPPQLQRAQSHDLGVPKKQSMGYQNFSAGAGWDDYEPGYTSPDENVDTNVQGKSNSDNQGHLGSSQFQQQMVHWPGEAIRSKQDSFSAAMLGPNNNEKQPLGDRKLERSLTFGGAHVKDSNTTAMGTHPYPQMSHHLRNASETFSGKASSFLSPAKPTGLGERIERASPFTQERPNSLNMYRASSAEDENGTTGNPLMNSELSFFARWDYNDGNSNLPGLRRSPSLESFDNQLEQIALENEEAGAAPPAPLQSKRPRNHTPVKENNGLWNSLGFSFSPDRGLGQDAQSEDMKRLNNMVSHVVSEGAPPPQAQSDHSSGLSAEGEEYHPISTSSTASGDAEMIKRQRRLRVFQEITLFPGSPQHVV